MAFIKQSIFIFSLMYPLVVSAQSFSVKVVDEKSGEPIPFATVETGENQGVITNEDGIFTISEAYERQPQDSIYISSLGFARKGVLLQNVTEGLIALTPKEFEIKEVFLSNNPLDSEEIIDRVKENLATNYNTGFSEKKIFFRQSDYHKMNKIDFGFQESTIEELTKELMDSIALILPKTATHYVEVAGKLYDNYTAPKLYIDKAAELYDKSKDVSTDALIQRFEKILKENIKPNSYLKIKSGFFGTKIDLEEGDPDSEDGRVFQIKNENPEEELTLQQNRKKRIAYIYEQLFFNEDSELDFLDKSNRYNFELTEYTYIDDASVYVIEFTPKGKKDFKGVLYVNTEDFAIMRLEFNNVRPLKTFGMFGVHYKRSVFKGKMLFGKDQHGKYVPRYIEIEDGSSFGVERPLKVIEKNKHVKGRRKQNELSLELTLQGASRVKYELVVFASETISKSTYQAAPENPAVKATYLSRYDPTFWKDYTIMEPNQAIQAFKVMDE